MPRAKKKYDPFEVPLINIGRKSGVDKDVHIFPIEIIEQIAGSIAIGKKYTVEEVSPVERQLKKIQLFDSWEEHAMADVVSCRVDNSVFYITVVPRSNKYGKLLVTAMGVGGLERTEFFPVGIGDVDENGVITSYKLSYVAFETKDAK